MRNRQQHSFFPAPGRSPARRRRGFTAIEMSAVITIILILSLILIPIVRSRVEESKVVAAQDDMAQIEKAELFAYSYTNHFFRLWDLERPVPNLTDATLTPAQRTRELLKLPNAYWNEPVLNTTGLTDTWKGPFLAIHKSATVATLLATNPSMFRGDGDPQAQQGPILVIAADRNDWQVPNDNSALLRARYPIDPWGSPYLFFGPGKIGNSGGQIALPTANETDFGTSIVYSMGPDNLAGSVQQNQRQSILFFRESGVLGTGDDLSREF